MTRTKLMLLASVATGIMMQPAMALDAQAFVDRAAAVYKTIGYDLKFGTATLDGDTITVDGVTVSIVASPTETTEPMVFDTTLTFSGVTELPDGGYKAAALTIPDIDTDFEAEPAGHVSLSDIKVDGVYLPGGDTVPAIALLQLWQSFSTGALSVERDGEEVIGIDSIEAGSTFNPEQGSADLVDLQSTLAINGISVDLSTLSAEDPSAGAVIEALGLTSIAGDITQNLTWSMADGHMVVDEFLFDFADVGALDITADITGFTPQVLDQIYAMQAQMAQSGTPSDDQAQAQMMSGMAIMQGVSIVGASIRYDDASLAGKLLDFFAAQSGTDRAAFCRGPQVDTAAPSSRRPALPRSTMWWCLRYPNSSTIRRAWRSRWRRPPPLRCWC